jgi:hypothetical protein
VNRERRGVVQRDALGKAVHSNGCGEVAWAPPRDRRIRRDWQLAPMQIGRQQVADMANKRCVVSVSGDSGFLFSA